MKILDGKELAGFIKERQAGELKSLQKKGVLPKLVIIRDSSNPVIVKYVSLKIRYGQDIGVKVEDILVGNTEEAKAAIISANQDKNVSGIIVQLPLVNAEKTDEVVSLIAPEKDVDGLSGSVKDLRLVHRDMDYINIGGSEGKEYATTKDNWSQKSSTIARLFDSATATAINWLLTGYDIKLSGKKIALVGRGRLVGAPLYRMFKNSGLDVTVFGHDGDLGQLCDFDVVISATGVAHLIKPKMIKPGAVVIDAGTASEGGKLVGDLDPGMYHRSDLMAITPEKGGVGPLTVAVLFDNVIRAALIDRQI